MAQPKDFGFGSEEQMIRASAKKFLDEHCNVEKLRALVAGDPRPERENKAAWDETLWNKCVELGWTQLAVPEAAGGAGMKMVAIAALAEEIGRHAFPSPILSTFFATFVLRECGTDAAKAALGKITEGAPMTLAITNAGGSWNALDTDVEAKGDKLSGTASFVQDARKVKFFVVSARSGKDVGLYLVPADGKGVSIKADRIVDLTRDQARVEFKDVAATALAPAGQGGKALSKALPSILTTLAADLVGGAEWALQTTVQYAKVREQFGHPIGFFQAVKHPLVNAMIAIDQAKSLVYNAACAIDTEPEEAEKFARMAKAAASDAASFASDRAVQLHGGIGFTWECDVHIFFKRNKHGQFLFGDAPQQRRKLAPMIVR
ncbi:MAG: acyl-CoA dehydrogenase family protein [Bdellovibrionota bacterium]